MERNEIFLQKDRDFVRDHSNKGVDLYKYSLGQIRVLQRAKAIAIEYKTTALKGAAAGAAVGVLGLGIGVVPGAVIGFFAGIGVRAYGAPADAIDTMLTRVQGDIDNDLK